MLATSPPHRQLFRITWALWTAVVLVLGTRSFGQATTSSWFGALLTWFWPELSPLTVEVFDWVVRKCAHIVVYALHGALGAAAAAPSHAARLSWVASTLVAGSDEWLQHKTPGRTGSPLDVALDGAAAWCGMRAHMAWQQRRARRQPGRAT